MKRDMLKELGLSDDAIEKIMAENGRDVERAKGDLATKEGELAAKKAEIDGLAAQLKERDKDISDLQARQGSNEDLNKQLESLKEKYETDTAALNQRLEDMQTDHAIGKFFEGIPFASTLARKAAMAEFKVKGFKRDGEKFIGADEFISELKKNDPSAFQPEEKPEQTDMPRFTRPITSAPAGDVNPFGFNFTGVRPPKSN